MACVWFTVCTGFGGCEWRAVGIGLSGVGCVCVAWLWNGGWLAGRVPGTSTAVVHIGLHIQAPPEPGRMSKLVSTARPGVDSSRRRHKMSRIGDDKLAAALRAGLPPRSERRKTILMTTANGHCAQEDWLARWQPEIRLPSPNDKRRGEDWSRDEMGITLFCNWRRIKRKKR